ncbi:hypothetical protein D7X74_37065 [Corallococcus sp. CA047B]|nr:hypothetical protein D7X74_37065 [Corallococcus sp. CA047B]
MGAAQFRGHPRCDGRSTGCPRTRRIRRSPGRRTVSSRQVLAEKPFPATPVGNFLPGRPGARGRARSRHDDRDAHRSPCTRRRHAFCRSLSRHRHWTHEASMPSSTCERHMLKNQKRGLEVGHLLAAVRRLGERGAAGRRRLCVRIWMSTLGLVACNFQRVPPPKPLEVPAPTAEAKAPEAFAAAPVAEAVKGQKSKVWLQGIDISRYQLTVNWDDLKSKADFVFVKATESTNLRDSRFTTHWSGARKAGLPRGAYHFFHPKEDVDKQVANFTKRLKPDPGELPPVVDVEAFKNEYDGFTCVQLAGMLQRFSEGVEKELGCKPMIYTNHVTWSTNFCDHPYFVDSPLWLAAYTNQTEPRLPKGWKRWHFWQYTESGKVAGIDGQVDQNYFNGTSEELKALFVTK